jgi:hypothetical protein
MLAAELRDAVARRHALAIGRVGRSTACPFDVPALVPVPTEILRLGRTIPRRCSGCGRNGAPPSRCGA